MSPSATPHALADLGTNGSANKKHQSKCQAKQETIFVVNGRTEVTERIPDETTYGYTNSVAVR